MMCWSKALDMTCCGAGSFEVLDQARPRHDTGVNHYDRRSEIWIGRSQLEGDIPTHAVADNDRFFNRALAAEPYDIFGESGHGVRLLGLVALTVATEVDCDYPLRATKVLELRCKEGMVADPAVDENDGWVSRPGLIVGQGYAVTCEFLHVAPSSASN
jgi:hypothetical protein